METKRNRSNKTFALGLVGGLGLAAALGAGFLLGGGRASESATTHDDAGAALRAYAAAAAVEEQQAPAGQPASDDGGSGAPQSAPSDNNSGAAIEPVAEEPAVEPSPTPVAEEPEEPEITPTSTPGCNFCGSGDIANAPTATPDPDPDPNPCPFCVDAVMGTLIDVTPPIITNVDTSFCFPILVVSLEVDAPAEVWFEYSYDDSTYDSIHKDVIDETFIPEDLGGFGWGVYSIYNLEIHAIDLSGNHAVVDVAMPEPDLVC